MKRPIRQTWQTPPKDAAWRTRSRGKNVDEYAIYLALADDGNGIDVTTGKPMKTYGEWLTS